MAEPAFHLPRGAILFSEGGVAYEFREALGEAGPGITLLLARKRTKRGVGGRVLLKAVGWPGGAGGIRVFRARARLEEEVRLATFLDHPGIVRVHGLHKAEGAWYVITERPEGNSLNDLLMLAMEGGRCFSPSLVMHVGAQAADALHHAHTRTDGHGRALKIIHRAIDPDHLFMDWEGCVRVADFGLAHSALRGRVASSVRRPRGDIYYASPEMLLSARVDARSDLFSLGLVMLELATGRHLLDVPNGVPEKVRAALSPTQRERVRRAIQRARLADCPAALDDILWRAATYTPEEVNGLTADLPPPLRDTLRDLLRRSRSERVQTADEVAQALRSGLGTAYGARETAAELQTFAVAGRARLKELATPRSEHRVRRSENEPV